MNLAARASFTKHTKWMIAMVVACTLLTVLPGCGIPTLRNPLAGRELPDSFNGEISSENSAQVGIEEFFNDPILTNLISQGLTENYQLKILGEEIEIANNEVLRRRGAYLPFVNIGAGARLDKFSSFTLLGADNRLNTLPSGGNFPSPLPNFLAAANVSWQVDIWRQLRNSRDAQILRYLGTTDGRNY
ncbi:MAG: TolC family protein, partial [Planctomycetota bacterium]